MKSSPFDSFAELSASTGVIHTFAGSPGFIYVCIGLTVIVLALLIVKSYLTKH